jgi:hypothetical protein
MYLVVALFLVGLVTEADARGVAMAAPLAERAALELVKRGVIGISPQLKEKAVDKEFEWQQEAKNAAEDCLGVARADRPIQSGSGEGFSFDIYSVNGKVVRVLHHYKGHTFPGGKSVPQHYHASVWKGGKDTVPKGEDKEGWNDTPHCRIGGVPVHHFFYKKKGRK